jgi:hypothetical protein
MTIDLPTVGNGLRAVPCGALDADVAAERNDVGTSFKERHRGRSLQVMLLTLSVLTCASPAAARTITLTGGDCEDVAILNADVPRMSYGVVIDNGVVRADHNLRLYSNTAVLLRYPIERIPAGQRITKAELTIAVNYLYANNSEIHVRRLLADWGTGVCHDFRQAYPEKLPWAEPGGLGDGKDRVAKSSAVFKVDKIAEYTVDVTEDVDLWYTGGAVNRGWIITPDIGGIHLLPPYSPQYGGSSQWRLRITYEPE